MRTTTVRHAHLQNGDIVHVQGYRFRVTNLRTYNAEAGDKAVVRYEGICAESCDISDTGYNGGTYGAYAHVLIPVEREHCHRCGDVKPLRESCACFDNGCQ